MRWRHSGLRSGAPELAHYFVLPRAPCMHNRLRMLANQVKAEASRTARIALGRQNVLRLDLRLETCKPPPPTFEGVPSAASACERCGLLRYPHRLGCSSRQCSSKQYPYVLNPSSRQLEPGGVPPLRRGHRGPALSSWPNRMPAPLLSRLPVPPSAAHSPLPRPPLTPRARRNPHMHVALLDSLPNTRLRSIDFSLLARAPRTHGSKNKQHSWSFAAWRRRCPRGREGAVADRFRQRLTRASAQWHHPELGPNERHCLRDRPRTSLGRVARTPRQRGTLRDEGPPQAGARIVHTYRIGVRRARVPA